MTKNIKLEKELEGIFLQGNIKKFSLEWILNKLKTKDSFIEVYNFLKNIGASKKKIKKRAELLTIDPNIIKKNYEFLKKIGLSNKKIISQIQLLGRNPQSIVENYKGLKEIGIPDKKIATNAQLLGRNYKTIIKKYEDLINLGIPKEKIISQAQLLGRNIKTIKKNYQSHISLLKINYKDRTYGKNLILKQPQILEIPPQTINSNVQYLYYTLGINYYDIFQLTTKTQTKRKKIVWMLRELLNYKNLLKDEKKLAIKTIYNYIKNNPELLKKSIKSLEKEKEKLTYKINKYC